MYEPSFQDMLFPLRNSHSKISIFFIEFIGVRSLEGQLFDMVFVGTTHGRVLKLANLITNNNHFRSNDPVLIESIQLFPYHIPVRNILVVNSENEPGRLIILSDHEVISVPMHRCGSEGTKQSWQLKWPLLLPLGTTDR